MTLTQLPDVSLPPGADQSGDRTDEWQPAQYGFQAYRCVWSESFAQSPDVRAVVVQYADGSIAREGDDRPLIYIGNDDCSIAEARALAVALIAAADLADGWAGQQ